MTIASTAGAFDPIPATETGTATETHGLIGPGPSLGSLKRGMLAEVVVSVSRQRLKSATFLSYDYKKCKG